MTRPFLPHGLLTSAIERRSLSALSPASGLAIDFQSAGAPQPGDWAALARAHNELPDEALPPAMFIWGAGGFGRRLAARLREAGRRVAGFVDQNGALNTGGVDALPCYSPAELLERERLPVAVGVHNFASDFRAARAALAAAGFDVWETPRLWRAQAAERLGWPGVFWLDSPFWGQGDLMLALEQAREAFEAFADEASARLFWGELCARALGEARLRAAPEPGQYAPASLPRWSEPVRLVDAGAFNGDTLRFFDREGLRVQQALCFEPDLANFESLAASRPAGMDAMCWPLGLSDRAKTLRFRLDGAASSRLSEEGEAVVQCVGLDQAAPGFGPTLVKMDIEGAELDALDGARESIARHRPALAVSAYHLPEHLWLVPLKLRELAPGRPLCLRAHGHNGFDTVAYVLESGEPR
jgi:FkbM family methyltransferase